MPNITAILDNIKQVSLSQSSMEILQEFERVIDENGLYAFHFWKQGELVDGPIVSAYRVKCTFQYPLTKMPDPSGAARLVPLGCKVYYTKDWLVYPIKVKSESDYRAGIKKPKLARTPVWLVTIDIPKHLIKSIEKGANELLDDTIDMADLDDAYEENLTDENPDEQAQNQQMNQQQPGGFNTPQQGGF